MNTTPQLPNPKNVKAACERFDREHALAEQTLQELFKQFPLNDDLRYVLLKVLAVNSLYHTCVYELEAVARHIHANAKNIDAGIAQGSPEVVDTIARVTVRGKPHNFFSFATKYCSWHNPEKYPIYDSRVDNYLWTMHNAVKFAGFSHPDLWNYPKFLNVMSAFRESQGLESFTFKELDKFIFLECEPPASFIEEPHQSGPGAFDYYPSDQIIA